MANTDLSQAKKKKKDEFYTQWQEIEKEINTYLEYDSNVFRGKIILLPCDDPEWSNFTKFFAQNFENFGLKKLISTSYSAQSKKIVGHYHPTLFEKDDPQYDKRKTITNGKIFTLIEDRTGDGKIDVEDLDWEYMKGDGNYRSEEVTRLRDEADIIITNPPFSLFRDFLSWITEADTEKKFSIIGNVNAITYKETFPLIKENKMWLGSSISSGDREFRVPENYPINSAGWRIDDEGNKYINVKGVRWYTNFDHGRRHQKLDNMSMQDNKKFNKKIQQSDIAYQKYDNYDAIEIPFTNAIPCDYDGVMGVPITFMDKYNPEQFDILGATQRGCHDEVPDLKKYNDYWEVRQSGEKTGSSGGKTNENANLVYNDNRKNYFENKQGRIIQSAYQRIFIKHKKK